MSKFGTMLISRPAGREALLAAQSYVLPKENAESIELDFSGVDVLTPSWADEFVSPLVSKHGFHALRVITGANESVIASLTVIQPELKLS